MVQIDTLDHLFALKMRYQTCFVDDCLLFCLSYVLDSFHCKSFAIGFTLDFEDGTEATLSNLFHTVVLERRVRLFQLDRLVNMFLDLLIRAQALDTLFLLLNGHVEAHERELFQHIVILLNSHGQAHRQALPLNFAITVVNHPYLFVLTRVVQVLYHEVIVIDLRRLALVNGEVYGALWLDSWNVNYASSERVSTCSNNLTF